MPELIKAREPFRFFTRLQLTELTGLKAHNLSELLALIKEVSGSCIYHHTHGFLQQHHYLTPEPPNDFAYWASEILREESLGEKLASIDTMQFLTIRDLRNNIIEIIESHIKNEHLSKNKFADKGEEFHFMKSVSFIAPTGYVANDLNEFVDI
ncbi:MAG: DUF5752 family protein, partial [Elusimicrobiota bacterium]